MSAAPAAIGASGRAIAASASDIDLTSVIYTPDASAPFAGSPARDDIEFAQCSFDFLRKILDACVPLRPPRISKLRRRPGPHLEPSFGFRQILAHVAERTRLSAEFLDLIFM
jgi:hypothetical protein